MTAQGIIERNGNERKIIQRGTGVRNDAFGVSFVETRRSTLEFFHHLTLHVFEKTERLALKAHLNILGTKVEVFFFPLNNRCE